jgi:hypothetical protein
MTNSTDDYLEDLSKWQAMSHPELAESKPEHLLDPKHVQRYKRLQENVWWRITRLHGTLYTLEQLRQFPFEYIYASGRMEFWRLVGENFVDTGILLLHGLVNDSGQDVLSLGSFRNAIVEMQWLPQAQEKLELLRRTLKERRYGRRVKLIAERVDKIRDNRIAHPVVDIAKGAPREALTGVSLEELWQLFQAAHSLFGALSFGAGYVTLAGDLMPGTVGGKRIRTCLDEVFDSVLRDSAFVNRPERRAQWWQDERKYMDPEGLRIMNEMRKRIGRSEA